MNLLDLFVKISVDDQASQNVETLGSKIGKGLEAAAAVGVAAVSAAATGVAALTKQSVENYAEYEQLVGGVETLFKDSADTVQRYAANAYKTAGLDANGYMETITGFAASMLQSLDGNTRAAAEYSNQAVIDMSDNANKMGSSMTSIQNAYQGFAKQNYTMLDNLKLGYGGTAAEMHRLMSDAAELDEQFRATAQFSIDSKGHLTASFADITQAIHIVQTELGITGTTSLEAGSTISGSAHMMKSSWENLVTGMADENKSFTNLVIRFVSSVETFADNLLPRVEIALGGVVSLIEKLAPKIVERLPGLVESVLPSLINAAVSMVNAVAEVLPGLVETVVPVAIDAAVKLIDAVLVMLPTLALTLINVLSDALVTNIPVLIPSVVDVVVKLAMMLTDPTTLVNIIDASLQIILALADGILEAVPQLVEAAPVIVQRLVDALIYALPLMIEVGEQIIGKILECTKNNLPKLVEAGLSIVSAIGDGIGKEIPFLSGVFGDLEYIVVAVTAAFVTYKGVMIAMEVISKIKTMTEGMTIAQAALNAVMSANPFALVAALVVGLGTALATAWKTNEDFRNGVIEIWEGIKKFFTETLVGLAEKAKTWGKDLIDNFTNGIKEKLNKLKETVANVGQSIKDFLGFSEPKLGPLSNFHTYAPDMMDLFAQGIRENEHVVTDQIAKSFDFGQQTISFAASAQGKSSSAMINSMMLSDQSEGKTYVAELYLDGERVAESTYKPMKKIAKREGAAGLA